MKAGHYSGTTADGEPLSFDVTEAGEVTNVIASVAGTSVVISKRYRLDGAGRWGGSVSGAGVEACIRGRVGSTSASGTLRAELSRAGSVHAAGPIRWRATRVLGTC